VAVSRLVLAWGWLVEIGEGAEEDEVVEGDLTEGSTWQGGGRRKDRDGSRPHGADGNDLGTTASE